MFGGAEKVPRGVLQDHDSGAGDGEDESGFKGRTHSAQLGLIPNL